MRSNNKTFDLLLFSVVIIFCGVIIYVAILHSSIKIGITLLPLLLFISLAYLVSIKKGNQNHNV